MECQRQYAIESIAKVTEFRQTTSKQLDDIATNWNTICENQFQNTCLNNIFQLCPKIRIHLSPNRRVTRSAPHNISKSSTNSGPGRSTSLDTALESSFQSQDFLAEADEQTNVTLETNRHGNTDVIIERLGRSSFKRGFNKGTFRDSQKSTCSQVMLRKPLAKTVIMICGRVNSGKSTFIREFLQGQIPLPVNETACTSRFTHISYSKKPELRIVSPEGIISSRADLSDDSQSNKELLLSYISLDEDHKQNLDSVCNVIEIGIPSDILKNGLEIYDCPGLSENSVISTMVLEKMPHLLPHILIYIFDCQSGFSLSDKRYLDSIWKLIPDLRHQTLILANKIDINQEAKNIDEPTKLNGFSSLSSSSSFSSANNGTNYSHFNPLISDDSEIRGSSGNKLAQLDIGKFQRVGSFEIRRSPSVKEDPDILSLYNKGDIMRCVKECHYDFPADNLIGYSTGKLEDHRYDQDDKTCFPFLKSHSQFLNKLTNLIVSINENEIRTFEIGFQKIESSVSYGRINQNEQDHFLEAKSQQLHSLYETDKNILLSVQAHLGVEWKIDVYNKDLQTLTGTTTQIYDQTFFTDLNKIIAKHFGENNSPTVLSSLTKVHLITIYVLHRFFNKVVQCLHNAKGVPSAEVCDNIVQQFDLWNLCHACCSKLEHDFIDTNKSQLANPEYVDSYIRSLQSSSLVTNLIAILEDQINKIQNQRFSEFEQFKKELYDAKFNLEQNKEIVEMVLDTVLVFSFWLKTLKLNPEQYNFLMRKPMINLNSGDSYKLFSGEDVNLAVFSLDDKIFEPHIRKVLSKQHFSNLRSTISSDHYYFPNYTRFRQEEQQLFPYLSYPRVEYFDKKTNVFVIATTNYRRLIDFFEHSFEGIEQFAAQVAEHLLGIYSQNALRQLHNFFRPDTPVVVETTSEIKFQINVSCSALPLVLKDHYLVPRFNIKPSLGSSLAQDIYNYGWFLWLLVVGKPDKSCIPPMFENQVPGQEDWSDVERGYHWIKPLLSDKSIGGERILQCPAYLKKLIKKCWSVKSNLVNSEIQKMFNKYLIKTHSSKTQCKLS